MQHILLTGATGFLGSHLLEALLTQGYQVTILKRSTSDTWRIDHLLCQVSAFDVDRLPVEKAFEAQNVDVVIHTACTYGRHGQSAYKVAETNIMFALQLLDAATSFNVNTFINSGTLLPKYLNAYSLSKKHFAEWLKQRSDKVQAINLKLEHMYGPKDDQTKFVPWLISQFEQGVERVSLTEGKQQRDFIYIDDVISAYLLTLQKANQLPEYSDFDVGTGRLTSVFEFVTALYENYKRLNPNTVTQLGFGDIPMREGEIMAVEVDNKALKTLGWNAKILQNEGFERLFKVVS
ncbi:NAD-dependent epimerase/dehydratase family protein [Marinobacter gelidimuriae]|uniref:NAD-dependent epimerase/dehydratase family protein n=1 Tax=Marinobacter gelidimuriae TaxID=2739064 RepID=UPI0003772DDB|nr:NAD-dependent epimerase/dehydratase family protein [Marinobacter gelidimuriae]